MFCRFCGKEIENVKYCPHCGKSVDKVSLNADTVNKAVANVKKTALAVGYNRLFMLTSVIGTVVNVIIRICNNEITTVRVALAQDDYYRLSGPGRVWSVVIVLIQLLIYAALWYDTKKRVNRSSVSEDDHLKTELNGKETGSESCEIAKKSYIIAGILLVIQVAVMLISIPAPY